MTLDSDTYRNENEPEAGEVGSTMVLTETGWEASDYVEPGDDWLMLEDGSYVSPDERIRTWPLAGPVA